MELGPVKSNYLIFPQAGSIFKILPDRVTRQRKFEFGDLPNQMLNKQIRPQGKTTISKAAWLGFSLLVLLGCPSTNIGTIPHVNFDNFSLLHSGFGAVRTSVELLVQSWRSYKIRTLFVQSCRHSLPKVDVVFAKCGHCFHKVDVLCTNVCTN